MGREGEGREGKRRDIAALSKLTRSLPVNINHNIQGGPKSKPAYFAITLSTGSQCSQFLAHIHYRKFATGGYIVSPPNLVYVTTLPCKISTTTFITLTSIHCCCFAVAKKSSFYVDSNNCQFLSTDFYKNRNWLILLTFKWRLRPCYGSRRRN